MSNILFFTQWIAPLAFAAELLIEPEVISPDRCARQITPAPITNPAYPLVNICTPLKYLIVMYLSALMRKNGDRKAISRRNLNNFSIFTTFHPSLPIPCLLLSSYLLYFCLYKNTL